MAIRTTRQFVETLASGSGSLRATRQMVEVLAPVPTTTGTNLTASNTVAFTQIGDVEQGAKTLTASNTLSLTQTADRQGEFSATASNTLSFSQSNVVAGLKSVTASNSLSLTHAGTSGLYARTASNYLQLTQQADVGGVKEVTASNAISFSQAASSGLFSRSAHSFLDLEQLAAGGFVSINAIPLTASSSITFAQSVIRALALASGTALTADNTLTLTQRAIFPIVLTAEGSITFSQVADGNAGKSGTSELVFTQTVVANHWRSLTASNSISFAHGFSAVQFRNGIPVLGVGGCDATKTYAPFSGGDSPIIRPVAPALNRKTNVEFFYPTGPSCAATNSITLRTPNFGDRDRNQYNRINRESRGGSLTVYRDPQWPKIRTLVMDFSGIKDSEVDGIIEFLEDTLGQQIAFRDWNSRVWYGLITNPDSAITRTGTNRNDIALEMEVTDTALEVNACSEISFSQSNARVVEVP